MLFYNAGILPEPKNIASCNGDEIVYNCTVNATTHGWAISGYSNKEVIILDIDGSREASIGPFMLRLVDTDPLISSVSVVTQGGLTDTDVQVTCFDASQSETSGMEVVNITVLGMCHTVCTIMTIIRRCLIA